MNLEAEKMKEVQITPICEEDEVYDEIYQREMIPFPDGRFLGSLLFRKLTKHKSVTTSIFQGTLRTLVKLIQLF